MTTSTDTRQAQFQHAWDDLGQRLNSGIDRLEEVATGISTKTEYNRLVAKRDAVVDARSTYDDLARGPLGRADDFAGMWRTFTDVLSMLLKTDDREFGYYQGTHLALTYQRGYGSDVDAPVIRNPHTAH